VNGGFEYNSITLIGRVATAYLRYIVSYSKQGFDID